MCCECGVQQPNHFNNLNPLQSHEPFTGSYIPTQRLGFMYEGGDGTLASEGGSQGTWILRVEDPTLNGTQKEIALNGWSLKLCGTEAPQETIVETAEGTSTEDAVIQATSLVSPPPTAESTTR